MMSAIHKTVVACIYLALVIGAVVWAYSDGPSDAEMFRRAAEPFNL